MDLVRLQEALRLLSSQDYKNVPLHHMLVWSFIAQRKNCTYKEIQEKFLLSNASASRIVNSLSYSSPHRKKCLGLVDIRRDESEGRRYRVHLSSHGKDLLRQLEAL